MATSIWKIELDSDITESVISIQRNILYIWNRWQHILSIWTSEKSPIPYAVLHPTVIYGFSHTSVTEDDLKKIDFVSDIQDVKLSVREITAKLYDNSSVASDGSTGLRDFGIRLQRRWKIIHPAVCRLVICETEDEIRNMLKNMSFPPTLMKRALGTVLTNTEDLSESIRICGVDVTVRNILDPDLKIHVKSILFGPSVKFLDNLIHEAWSLYIEIDRTLENDGIPEMEHSYLIIRRDTYDLFLDAKKMQETLNYRIHVKHRCYCFEPYRISTIPSDVKKEIVSFPSVRGMSLQYERLKIILEAGISQENKHTIEHKIRETLRKNLLYIDLILCVQSGDNSVKQFARITQGSKVINNVSNDPSKYGTLGICIKINEQKQIALTAAHVLMDGLDVYLQSKNDRFKIGTCGWSTFKQDTINFEKKYQALSDFAVIDIDPNVFEDMCFEFRTNAGEKLPIYLPKQHYAEKAQGETLYKRGAKTGCTEGLISEVEELKVHKIDSNDDDESLTFFVVHGKDGAVFSKAGDSGAITFTVDDDKKIIRIVAMVQGGDEKMDEIFCSSILGCLDRYQRATATASIGLTIEND